MPRTTKRGPVDKSLADIQLFFRLTDWAELWQEWYLKIGPDGLALYKSIRQFASAKKESEAQYQFLLWLLGPKTDLQDPRNIKYKFAPQDAPWDWFERRKSGGWYTDGALKAYSKKLRLAQNVLDSMTEVGDDTIGNQLYRIELMRQRLDAAMHGELMSEGVTWKENMERGSYYLSCHERLDKLMFSALKQYALTRGINYDDMAGFQALISGMRLLDTNTQSASQAEKTLADAIQMSIRKAKTYDLDVPDALDEAIRKSLPPPEDKGGGGKVN